MVMPSKVENTSYLIQTTQRSLILKFLLLTLTSVCVLLLPAKLEAEANPANL